MPPPNPQKNSVQIIKPGDKLPVVKATLKPGEMPDKRPDDNWVPPAATAWETYAGNGEPFLSGLGSMVIHGLVILVIVTGVLAIFNRSKPAEVDLDPIEFGNGFEGGGGGNPQGVGLAPGNLTSKDEVKTLDKTNDPLKDLPMDDPMVKKSTGPTIDQDTDTDIIAKIQNKTPKAANVGPILKDALEGLAGFGKGGSGRGGGEGTGVGTGRGSGEGPGTGRTSRRGMRVLRWELKFTFSSAANFIQQLDALGTYVGVPDSKTGKVMVIRDLHERPAKPKYEDIKALNRVWFVDSNSENNDAIAKEFGLDFVPSALIGLMPNSLEGELLDKELKFRGRKEEDIKRTVFAVSFSGGKSVIKVVEQEPKAGRR
jgi:hypothetical protein